MKYSFTMALALCAALAAPARSGDKVQTVGKDGLKIQTEIADNDAKVKVTEPNVNVSVDLPAKTFMVKLTGGKKYRFDLVSGVGNELDPVLAIQDGAGKQVAFNDDISASDLNSRVEFTPAADGTFKVICAALKGTGKLTLTVAQGAGGGDTGTKVGKETKIEGQVGQNDPKVQVKIIMDKGPELPAKVHQVKLGAGKKYQIDMAAKENAFDAFLVLEDKSGNQLDFDDDGGEGLNSRIKFICLRDDTYKIYAAALKGEGPYTLAIKEVPLTKEESTIHSIGAGGLKLNGKISRIAKAHNYQVKLEAGKTYVIDMISPDQKALDPYLKLFDSSGKMIAKDDDGGEGLNARITITAEAAGTYHVIATSFIGLGDGEFTFEVRQQE